MHVELCRYILEKVASNNNVTIDWNVGCEYTFSTLKTRGEGGFQHIKDTADKIGLSYNVGSKNSSIYINNNTEAQGKGDYTYTFYNSKDDPFDICQKIYNQYLDTLPEEEEEDPNDESKSPADTKPDLSSENVPESLPEEDS